jgi:hypothetical protein
MKRLFIATVITIFSLNTKAQNLSYLRNNLNQNIVTFDYYKQQSFGSFFTFSDFMVDKNGSYNVFSFFNQSFKLKNFNINLQHYTGLNENIIFKPVYILGLGKSISIYSVYFNFEGAYRYEQGHSYQIALNYNKSFSKVSLNGFLNFWDNNKYLSEHQVLYSINENLLIGSEVRLTNYLQNYCSIILKYKI